MHLPGERGDGVTDQLERAGRVAVVVIDEQQMRAGAPSHHEVPGFVAPAALAFRDDHLVAEAELRSNGRECGSEAVASFSRDDDREPNVYPASASSSPLASPSSPFSGSGSGAGSVG